MKYENIDRAVKIREEMWKLEDTLKDLDRPTLQVQIRGTDGSYVYFKTEAFTASRDTYHTIGIQFVEDAKHCLGIKLRELKNELETL